MAFRKTETKPTETRKRTAKPKKIDIFLKDNYNLKSQPETRRSSRSEDSLEEEIL